MKFKILAAGLILAMGFVSTPLAVANTQETNTENNNDQTQKVLGSDTENRNNEYNQRQKELQDRLVQHEERLQNQNGRRCELIKIRFEFHRDRAIAIREHRQSRYNHIVDRLNALAVRLDNNNIDNSELLTVIQDLTDLISTYASSFTDHETALQQALNVACDNSVDIKQMAANSRQSTTALKSNAQSIHDFFQVELKPALENIKELIKAERQAEIDSREQDQQSSEEEE